MHIDMSALKAISEDSGIPLKDMVATLENALLMAYNHGNDDPLPARVELDVQAGSVRVLVPEHNEQGDVIGEVDDTPSNFGRIAAATARQVIVQRLRDAETDRSFGEFAAREGQIVSGVINRDAKANQRGMVVVQLGPDADNLEGVLPATEKVPGEKYDHGSRIKCFIERVTKSPRGTHITLSRSHPELVRGLFELEIPEIEQGVVEITNIAREAGHRTKIAVRATVEGVNAKGSCIGPAGARVRNVMEELNGEKIDIIDFDEDPAIFVGNALSPSQVSSVEVTDADARSVRVVVPDFQLSLAIGKEGQNARLANRLTGWRIDIRSDNDPISEASPSNDDQAEQTAE